jgi:hypothetical protein
MALERMEDVEALADQLTDLANGLHQRLLHAIKAREVDQATAQTLFQQEASLRQKANSLYADAAGRVVHGLVLDQQDLVAAVDSAKHHIQAMSDFRKTMGLAGDVIDLGASVLAGKPAPILAALKQVESDLD